MNYTDLKNELVQWIKDWFEKNGPGCNAVIGLSGGKDSTIVAALCVEAIGKDRVIRSEEHRLNSSHRL
jgi:NAD+ synthase